jgi:hypothetical protein
MKMKTHLRLIAVLTASLIGFASTGVSLEAGSKMEPTVELNLAMRKKWSANGKALAAFLSSANPNWPLKDMEAMLQKHLDLTTGEVVGRLTKDWAKDIASYDEGHRHRLMFADMLSDGIIKQFPAKFMH